MKARSYKYEEGTAPAWQTIYCSLILLMLVLFVMLTSYSVTDKGKAAALRSNFPDNRYPLNAIGVAPGFLRVRKGGEAWRRQVQQSLRDILAGGPLADKIKEEPIRGGLKLIFPHDVLFPSGDSLNGKLHPYLDGISKIARENNLAVRIEGYAGNRPVRNTAFPSNWELSAAGAVKVLRYFTAKGEVSPGRLSAVGFGAYRAAAGNATAPSVEQNRRIEVVLRPATDGNH